MQPISGTVVSDLIRTLPVPEEDSELDECGLPSTCTSLRDLAGVPDGQVTGPHWVVQFLLSRLARAMLRCRGAGAVGGLLVGKRFGIGSVRLQDEADAMFGDLSASTNRLDPGCTDEAVSSRFRWIATVRVGVEETIGGVGVFVSGGPALARIVNSVTDTDYSGSTCLERDLRLDADDSFRRGSTEVGWAIGAGLEMPLATRWALRFDGSYLDFGSETYRVNLSGNNSCRPGGPMTPCRYTIRNRLGVVRLGIVYRFGE